MSDDYSDVLLEDINGKFNLLMEIVQDMRQKMATKDDLTEIKEDLTIIKAAVADLSAQVAKHEALLSS